MPLKSAYPSVPLNRARPMVPLERDFNDCHAILTQVFSREQGSPEESVERLPMELTLNRQSSGRGGKESRDCEWHSQQKGRKTQQRP